MPLTEIPFDLNAPVADAGEEASPEETKQSSLTVFGALEVPNSGFVFTCGDRRLDITASDTLVEVILTEGSVPRTFLSIAADVAFAGNLQGSVSEASFKIGDKLSQYAKSTPLASWAASVIQAHNGHLEDTSWYVTD